MASEAMQERLRENLLAVKERIDRACGRAGRSPEEVTLVAVTKYASLSAIQSLYDLGHRDFGESRPQALWERQPILPADIRWHMIGHVQTNKLRRTLPLIHLLHSLDRWSLAEALGQEAPKMPSPVPAFLEVNLTGESAKHGFAEAELRDHLDRLTAIPHVEIAGLMTMARLEADPQRCRPTFAALRTLRDWAQGHSSKGKKVRFLSMGMTNDFEIAIEEGATHVRIGSALFEGIES